MKLAAPLCCLTDHRERSFATLAGDEAGRFETLQNTDRCDGIARLVRTLVLQG